MPKWEKALLMSLLALVVVSAGVNLVKYYFEHSIILPKSGGNISIGLVGEPKKLNPILATSQVDQSLSKMVFSGLYTYNSQGELVPDLAQDYPSISSDGKQYTVSMSPKAFWHDGTPVTSKDVLFTIKTIQDQTINSPLRPLWLSTEVKTPDLHTLVFTTQETNAAFLHNLSFGLLPEHTWKNVTPEFFSTSPLNQKPLGNGPYAIRQIKRNKSGEIENVSLELFAQHNHPAHIQTISLSFYKDNTSLITAQEQGVVNAAFFVPSGENLEKLSLPLFRASTTLPTYQGIYFNTQSPFLENKFARQALSSTISWSELLNLWKGTLKPISTTPLGLHSQAFTKYFVYSQPDTLFKNSGLKKNSAGQITKGTLPVKLKLAAPNTYPYPEISKLIETNWKAVGIETEIQLLSLQDLILNVVRPRNFDVLLFFQTNSVDPEAFAFWHSSQAQDPGINITQLKLDEVDKLITQARTTIDPSERTTLYEQLRTVLDEQAAAILYGQATSYTFASEKIHGINDSAYPDTSWLLYSTTNWYLNKERAFQN